MMTMPKGYVKEIELSRKMTAIVYASLIGGYIS